MASGYCITRSDLGPHRQHVVFVPVTVLVTGLVSAHGAAGGSGAAEAGPPKRSAPGGQGSSSSSVHDRVGIEMGPSDIAGHRRGCTCLQPPAVL